MGNLIGNPATCMPRSPITRCRASASPSTWLAHNIAALSNPRASRSTCGMSSSFRAGILNGSVDLLNRLGVRATCGPTGGLTLCSPRAGAYRCAIYGSGTICNPRATWVFCLGGVAETFYRLLEDMDIRLLEDGSFRLLENAP